MLFYAGPVLAVVLLGWLLWVIAKMIRIYRDGDAARNAYKQEVESRRRSREATSYYPPFGGDGGD